MRRWVLSVNGERMFCKGANLGPTRMALGEATPAELAADVELAKGTGLDLLRIHGHVGRPETYDAADRAGGPDGRDTDTDVVLSTDEDEQRDDLTVQPGNS